MKVRAKTKDGKEVVGWYCKVDDRHFVSESDAGASLESDTGQEQFYDIGYFVEIDPATAAVDTGKDAKNGRIWGRYPKLGFEGGDKGC